MFFQQLASLTFKVCNVSNIPTIQNNICGNMRIYVSPLESYMHDF